MARRYTGQGGPINRRKRYDRQRLLRLSKQADADLVEMAKYLETKPATLIRRAVMIQVYIWKSERAKAEEAAAVLDGQLDLINDNGETSD